MPSRGPAKPKLGAPAVHMSTHKKTVGEADSATPGDNIRLPHFTHTLPTGLHGFVRSRGGWRVVIKPLKLRIFFSLVVRGACHC